MQYLSIVTEKYILTKGGDRKKRSYLEGEYGMWAWHRLVTAEFYFICYLFLFSLQFYLIGYGNFASCLKRFIFPF